MIRILKQRLMRFGSYTNLTLDYDGETTLIGGPNGSGKSQLIEALRYAFGNTDLQRPSSASEYYIKKGVPQRTASTVTLSNINDNGHADVFRRIQIKDAAVTMGVVYDPRKDDKIPRYHIMGGDVDIPTFVESAVKDGTSRRAFIAKLKQCHITPAVIKHLFVQQGTTGDLARKKPRDLYQLVLDQSGHTETKRVYEQALEEARKTQRQLDYRRSEEKRAVLDLDIAHSEVRRLDEYEAQERRLGDLLWEERIRVQWHNREKRARLEEEAEKTKSQLGPLTRQIDDLAERIGPFFDELDELKRQRDNWDNDVREARNHRRAAVDEYEKAREDFEAAVEQYKEWERVQSAPSVEEAKKSYKVADMRFTKCTQILTDRQKDRDLLHRRVEAIQENNFIVPEGVAKVLAECQKQGINVEVLAEVVGAQDPLMEGALTPFLWSIVCTDKDEAAVLGISRRLGSALPVVRKSNRFWSDWKQTEVVVTPFGTVAAGPKEEDRVLLDRDPATIETMQARLADLDRCIQDAEIKRQAAENMLSDARQMQRDAEEKMRLGANAPERRLRGNAMTTAKTAADNAEEHVRDLEANPPKVLASKIEERRLELDSLEKQLEELQFSREHLNDILQSAPEQIRELSASLKEIEEWPPDRRAEVEDADSPPRRQYDIDRDRKAAQKYVDTHEKPDEEVRLRHTNLEKRLKYLGDQIGAIEKNHEQNVQAVEDAKTQYGQTANDALAAFKKRFEAVSESFHVTPAVEYTRIRPNMDDDAIHDAELNISIQFGAKKPMRLQGGLSGGEGAVAGILLRLCMMNTNTVGFFVVDEPYQNLDARNVRLIADFLDQSAYQILLVVPTSDDPNQYRGALRAFRMREFNEKGLSPPPDRLGITHQKPVEMNPIAP